MDIMATVSDRETGEVLERLGPFDSPGAAPLYSGDPGYPSKLDRDGDGVACE